MAQPASATMVWLVLRLSVPHCGHLATRAQTPARVLCELTRTPALLTRTSRRWCRSSTCSMKRVRLSASLTSNATGWTCTSLPAVARTISAALAGVCRGGRGTGGGNEVGREQGTVAEHRRAPRALCQVTARHDDVKHIQLCQRRGQPEPWSTHSSTPTRVTARYNPACHRRPLCEPSFGNVSRAAR